MSRILLAEDDAATRRFLSAALEGAGHNVTSCADGMEAWHAFDASVKEAPYDLLLTDIVMPGLDGIELSARIRASTPSIRVIYITGFAAMVEHSQDTKANIIAKPFHLGKLVQEVETILKH